MREETFRFPSKDGKTQIHAVKWIPEDGAYHAVLQITHGMTEYIERYRDFADYMTKQGFLVVGNDHLGHGASVTAESEWGYFGKAAHPSDLLVADMHTLRTTIQGQEQGLPYFMLGHSMGSYMLRKYLCLHGEGVAGAVIMGTGTVPDATTNMGLFVCRVLEKIYGDHHRSNLVRKLSYTKSYRSYDCYGKDLTKSWLSKNVENIRSYAADPRCTFTFTVNGYQGLMEAVQYDNQMEHIKQTPRDLPLLFVSGALDPVGDLGEGVKTVYQMYQKAGFSDVTMKLYEDDRHEILNELDRELVYADLGAWLTRKGNE